MWSVIVISIKRGWKQNPRKFPRYKNTCSLSLTCSLHKHSQPWRPSLVVAFVPLAAPAADFRLLFRQHVEYSMCD